MVLLVVKFGTKCFCGVCACGNGNYLGIVYTKVKKAGKLTCGGF
jgi:hypothetical protein